MHASCNGRLAKIRTTHLPFSLRILLENLLRTEDGKAVTIPIKQGEMFLLPSRTPHQPRRGAGTIGLVIEVKRDDREMLDGLQWYCEQCNNLLHEYKFVLHNVEKDFIPRFQEFYGSIAHRTCKQCGHVMETDPRFV